MVTQPTHSKETYKFNFKEQHLHTEQRLVMHLWLVLQKQPPQVFCEKVFLENSQNSQENTCARVTSLIKLQALNRKVFLIASISSQIKC